MTITDNGLYFTLVDGTRTEDIFKSLIQNIVTNGDTVWIVYRYADDRTNKDCITGKDNNANVLVIDYNDITLPVVASGTEVRTWLLSGITSGGIEHVEDTAHTSGDLGIMPLAVRNDAGTSLVDTDGDYAPLMLNANGMLNTNLDNIRDAVPAIGSGNADGGTLRVSIATDDVNLAAINVDTTSLDNKEGTTGEAADVDGTRAGQLRYIGEAIDSVKASTAVPPYTHSVARGNFSAAYASNVTLTLSGTPKTVTNTMLVRIVVTNVSGVVTEYINGRNGVSMTISSNILTIVGAGTPFAATDEYDVNLNLFDKSEDQNTGSKIVSVLNTDPKHRTDVEPLINTTPYELTASFADVGSEFSVDTYKLATLWFTFDIGTSTNAQIRVFHKHTSGGTEEYREIYFGSPSSNVTTINLNDYEVGTDADQLFKLPLPVRGSKYIQIQAKDDAGGTGQITKLYVTKTY